MDFRYSKTRLKHVGEKLRHGEPLDEDDEIAFALFRSGHRNIIEAFRQKHKQMISSSKWKSRSIIFASRLKKRSTISMKLASRQSKMDLTRMNDIAGCRLIFPDVPSLVAYRNEFLMLGEKFGHYVSRTSNGQYDYIAKPRETGYRGIHDVYEETNDDSVKAKIEVQYRTKVQHSWATALEIWDSSHGHGAKFGLENEIVQNLFMYISELFWRYLDSSPDDKRIEASNRMLYKRIYDLNSQVGLISFFVDTKGLKAPHKYLKAVKNKESILLRRSLGEQGSKESETLSIIGRGWDDLTEEYFDDEKQDLRDSVLVSMEGQFVKKAYNNYFEDATEFKRNLKVALDRVYNDIPTFKRYFVSNVGSLVDGL